MAITSGYTPMNIRPASTPKPVVSQPAPAQKPQPMPQPNFAQSQPKPAPQQSAEPTEKSTKRFALRLTSKQRQQVKRLQKSWGLSTESAVIKKLIEDSKEEKNTNDLALHIQELTQIKAELNRIGVNINQISRKANQLQMTTDDLNAVVKYMNDVCELIYKKGLK